LQADSLRVTEFRQQVECALQRLDEAVARFIAS
jgi:hypothetical protein